MAEETTFGVAAVVPTFNRKDLLVECLHALRAQTRRVDHIFVVDNASTDGTQERLEETGFASDPAITIVRLTSNTGGAGAFYEGARRAHASRYSWIWLMDDDSEPRPDCLANLLASGAHDEIGALCPLIVGEDGLPQQYHHKKIGRLGFEKPVAVSPGDEPVEVDANAFVGPLVSSRAFDLVGYPEPGLFIWGDDTEFTWRLSKHLRVLLVPTAIILHKDGRIRQRGDAMPTWRMCYFVRNGAWIRRRHGRPLQNYASFYNAVWALTRRQGGLRNRIEVLRAFLSGFSSVVEARWRP